MKSIMRQFMARSILSERPSTDAHSKKSELVDRQTREL